MDNRPPARGNGRNQNIRGRRVGRIQLALVLNDAVLQQQSSDESENSAPDSEEDSEAGDSYIDEDEEEDEVWEADWDSDSQEYRRDPSPESERSSTSDSEGSVITLDSSIDAPAEIIIRRGRVRSISSTDSLHTVETLPSLASNMTSNSPQPANLKRPRLEDEKRNLPTDENDESMDEGCTICYEEYTTNGDHRLVSLKCGHFFGKNCIERWIRSEGRAASCPNCKQKTHSKDVRIHFTKAIQMTDNSAFEDIKAKNFELERKNNGLEMELAKTKRELTELQSKFKDSQKTMSSLSIPSAVKFKEMLFRQKAKQSLSIGNVAAGARSFDYIDDYFVIGVQLHNGGPFERFGVRKVNMDLITGTLNMPSASSFPLHNNRIRALANSPYQQNAILSGGEDKKATIHTVGSNTKRIWNMLGARSEVWTACWLSPNVFAVGTKDGRVYEYNTLFLDNSSPVRDITQGVGFYPITFLAYDDQSGVLLVGSFKKLMAYHNEAGFPLLDQVVDGFETIRSFAWDHSTLSFVVTFTSTEKPICHKLYKLEVGSGVVHCREIGEWKTLYRLNSTMWNNCLFSVPIEKGSNSHLFSVIFNEDQKRLEVNDWSGNRHTVVFSMPPAENACSIKAIDHPNGGKYIAVLTENHLYTFTFSC